MTRRLLAAATLVAAVCASSCSRSDAVGQTRRIAILPADVLTADPGYQWLSAAVPLVIAHDLAPSADVIASAAVNQSGVYASHSASTLSTTIGLHAGQFDLDSSVRDVASERVIRDNSLRQSRNQLIAALDTLAKQVDAHASTFSTRSEPALEAFAEGIASGDPNFKASRLKGAIARDSSFGLAYTSLIQLLAARSDPAAGSVLASAEAHRSSFTPLDQAGFDLLRTRLQRAPFRDQTGAASALLKLAPHDVDALAILGSGLFLQNNAREGEATLSRAIAINPESAELRRQLALGLLETKQFAESASILETLPPEPGTLFTDAIAWLLAGDSTRAAAAHEKFLGFVGNAELKTLFRARWQALSGQRLQAIKELTGAQFSDPRVAALGKAQLTLWQVLDKQFASAQISARGAGPDAELIARGAPSADAWQKSVDALPGTAVPAESKKLLLRYGYFLLGFYPQAVEAWRAADQQSGGADLPARTMLAASLRAAGKQDDVRKVPVQPFVPDPGDAFGVVSFSQLRSLLGQAE